jgi:hypothetical protein
MLVNTIGGHTGSHLVDTNTGSATSEFTISDDVAWTLNGASDAVPTAAGKASVHGDKDIHWDAPSYSGTDQLRPGFVQVKSEGGWTIAANSGVRVLWLPC